MPDSENVEVRMSEVGNFKKIRTLEELGDMIATISVHDIPGYFYTCDTCRMQFKNCIEHLNHQAVHRDFALFNYDKDIDNVELTMFQKVKTLEDLGDIIAITSVHDTPGYFYTCDTCLMEFKNCIEHLNHQAIHRDMDLFNSQEPSEDKLTKDEESKKIACPLCDKIMLKTSLRLHLNIHEEKYKCHLCPTRAPSKLSLHQHIISVHTDQKDYICETCGKGFSTSSKLSVHKKSHSNQRKYKCKLCDYAGKTASGLYAHNFTHSNEKCICEICSKTFKSSFHLNDHVKTVHYKIMKEECTYCGKKFSAKDKLRVHIRTHTGVRPYQCDICDKTFARSYTLTEHKMIHGERTFFGCDKCNKRFASKKGLTRHPCSRSAIK